MMGFLKKLFGRRKKEDREWEAKDREDDGIIRRDELDLSDEGERAKYVKSCLTQIRDAEEAALKLNQEYSMVTAYLTDMEEMEALPLAEKEELSQAAEKITVYERERQIYDDRKNRMPETKYRQMERMEEDVEEGLKKLGQCEEYQKRIKQDLNRLDGELHAFRYRKRELQGALVNLKGMVIICSCAFVACSVMLLILQLGLRMDTQIGYILTVAATVFAVAVIYLKYMDAVKELKKVEWSINRIILLQNRVKIRYVNNTNLLDYLCTKYGVMSGRELKDMWERFLEEREERERYQKLHEELVFYQKELLSCLRRFRIQYPEVWLRQTEAITDHKEMVEIRHNLIIRRQKLRGQMEYNQKMAESAGEEIKALAEEFPQYARQVQEMVEGFR